MVGETDILLSLYYKFTAKSVGEYCKNCKNQSACGKASGKNIVAPFSGHGLYNRMCVCVCVCVSLFLMHGHSFEWICTKFDMWHPYTLQMVTGVSKCHSSPPARAPRAYVRHYKSAANRGHMTTEVQN